MIDDFETCDEEKSYNEWVSQNLEFIQNNKQHIIVMKKLYIQGFAAGFKHKLKYNAQEILQK
jgi:hypothetical protein